MIDGEGMYAIPGLVDIHFHGAVGYDLHPNIVDLQIWRQKITDLTNAVFCIIKIRYNNSSHLI